MKIGFIGLGIMGSRMARNLQKAGHDLIVYNRSKAKASILLENGATWASTPAEVGQQSALVLTMLSTPEVVKAVAFGEEGLLAGMSEGQIWADCSTTNPSFVREMAETCAKQNIRFVDTPVAGTKAPAEKGELIFLVGADEATVSDLVPLFEIMGNKTLFFDQIGQGASMKMLINLLLAQSVAVFSEAAALGQAMGFALPTLLNLLPNLPVVAPVINALKPKLENGDWTTNFPLQWMQKDVHLATVSAYELGVPMPSLNAAKEIFAQAKAAGYAESDFSSVFAYLNAKSASTADNQSE